MNQAEFGCCNAAAFMALVEGDIYPPHHAWDGEPLAHQCQGIVNTPVLVFLHLGPEHAQGAVTWQYCTCIFCLFRVYGMV